MIVYSKGLEISLWFAVHNSELFLLAIISYLPFIQLGFRLWFSAPRSSDSEFPEWWKLDKWTFSVIWCDSFIQGSWQCNFIMIQTFFLRCPVSSTICFFTPFTSFLRNSLSFLLTDQDIILFSWKFPPKRYTPAPCPDHTTLIFHLLLIFFITVQLSSGVSTMAVI